MDRIQSCIIFMYGKMNELRDRGMIGGGFFRLSEGGLNEYAKLKKENFNPTEEEVKSVMSGILDAENKIIKDFNDGKDWELNFKI